MNKDTIMKIVEKVLDIGESPKHYASADICSSSAAFRVSMRIHCKNDNGISTGLEDTRYFGIDSDYEMAQEWIRKWSEKIKREREAHE